MPVLFSCPSCGASLKMANAPAAGAKIKCPKCGVAVAVPAQGSAPPPPAPAPARRPEPPADDFEERERNRPRKKKFKSKEKASGGNGLLIGLGVAGGVLLLAIGVLAIIFLTRDDKSGTNLAQGQTASPPSGAPSGPPSGPGGVFKDTRPSGSNLNRPADTQKPPQQNQPPGQPSKPADNKPADNKPPEDKSVASTGDANKPNDAKPPEEDKSKETAANKPKDKSGDDTKEISAKEGLEVGDLAPDIEGTDIDGKKFKLSDYRGKVVLLDFWGHW